MFKKKNSKSADVDNIPENASHSLKQEMIRSLLRKNTPESGERLTHSESVKETEDVDAFVNNNPDKNEISVLMKKINDVKDRTIFPKIDFIDGRITFPILSEIGKNESDIEFLDGLCKNEQILERHTFERILVCPHHPDSFSSNVRLYCPKCNSMDIKKLHLVEHIKCGYISEQINFESNSTKITKCPSCNKKIEDSIKELRIPAKWYSCNNCTEKFDNVLLKIHCRNFNHDFDINSAKSIDVPSFKIKTDETGTSIDTREIFEGLKKLLNEIGFKATENYSIQGRSGHYHSIDLYGLNEKNLSVFIFIKKSDSEIDNSEINSKIIQVLDTSPNISILVGFSSISEKAKSIASSYNVSIVASQNPNQIIDSTRKILSKCLVQIGANENAVCKT